MAMERGLRAFEGSNPSPCNFYMHSFFVAKQFTSQAHTKHAIPELMAGLFQDVSSQLISGFPNIFFAANVVGSWDMEIEIDAKNTRESHEIFSQIKANFDTVIRDYEGLIVYKEYAPNPLKYFGF